MNYFVQLLDDYGAIVSLCIFTFFGILYPGFCVIRDYKRDQRKKSAAPENFLEK